jgi:DNA-binding transcriptional LysR family regulator
MQLTDRIGRRMKLQDLHVLMAVVQAGSMRKAAARLNTTQPSISRSIAELEGALGVPLLDRNPHGVEPTTYGRALLDGGVAMFAATWPVTNIQQNAKLVVLVAGQIPVGSIGDG